MADSEVIDAIATNLAVREFDGRNLSEIDIRRILEAGRLCQSAHNDQPWHFILIRDKDVLNGLAALMKGDMDEQITRQAPMAIALISDSAAEFKFQLIDLGRAAQNMTLAAWELGIGSCFMSGPEPPEREAYRKRAHDFLRVPATKNFVDLVIFGYPKQLKLAKRKRRKLLSQIVSQEIFGRPLALKT